jgi:hypothetical protein
MDHVELIMTTEKDFHYLNNVFILVASLFTGKIPRVFVCAKPDLISVVKQSLIMQMMTSEKKETKEEREKKHKEFEQENNINITIISNKNNITNGNNKASTLNNI